MTDVVYGIVKCVRCDGRVGDRKRERQVILLGPSVTGGAVADETRRQMICILLGSLL